MRTLNIFHGVVLTFLLSACGADGLDATYTGAGGTQEFRFDPKGTLVQSLLGKDVAKFKYEKHGNEIKVFINENTNQIWTLKENGTISIPSGIILPPKK